MKKLINDPRHVVAEMLAGIVASDARLALLADERIVVRADLESWRSLGHVAVISGGGAGHEPAHAGYVGQGMLTAAVSGDVFTSPSVDSIVTAIAACADGAGVLLIVKNYTGDRLNFGLAAEIARARGIAVEMILVADDVASVSTSAEEGRRGIAGTILVHKIAGAAAAAGLPLEAVRTEAARAASQVATYGVGLSSCTVPAVGKAGFELGPDEMELGLGIHGERGVRRSTLDTADVVVEQMMQRICDELRLAGGERVALLVNNLGATTTMELGIVAGCALRYLQRRGVLVERAICGTFLTSLEMAGCSLSVMIVDDERLARLDAPADAPCWIGAARVVKGGVRLAAHEDSEQRTTAPVPNMPLDTDTRHVLREISSALIDAEAELTSLDQIAGDGDLGISMARVGEALRARVDALAMQSMPALLHDLAQLVRQQAGGSSGPLYAVGLLHAATCIEHSRLSLSDWAAALNAACRAIGELGGASRGDRTMLDALLPAADALRTAVQQGATIASALHQAAVAAEMGARLTAQMRARRGRARHLGDRVLGFPDPGARAVALWWDALRRAVSPTC